jgi:hypothetical protein
LLVDGLYENGLAALAFLRIAIPSLAADEGRVHHALVEGGDQLFPDLI